LRSSAVQRFQRTRYDRALSGELATFGRQLSGVKRDWDGVVQCEVLACEPPKLLRYSWKGGADSNPAYGSRLDSTVTWTLTPVEGGTHLRMVHDGFVFPGNQFAYDAMSPGWGRVLDGVARVTAEG
jgi:uncharacterized protein YndB with AHSA1/START domain